MSEIIEGQADRLIELNEETIGKLNTEDQALLQERVDEMQKKVADQVLKSPQGWDIVNQMAQAATQQVLGTSPFVLPYMQNKDVILEKLSDPVAFEKQFATLMADLGKHSRNINEIASKHKGKTGVPTEEDHALLFLLSEEYSRAADYYDSVIEPLMMSLIDIVAKEHGPILTVTVGE